MPSNKETKPNLSELFSVVRHVERWKPGSKPIQLYVRLSLRYIYIYIYIYILHGSVYDMGFMLYAFVRVKVFQKRPISIIDLLFERGFCLFVCIVTANWTKIPKRDFIFARVKTGQVGTWSPTEISPVQSSFLRQIRTGILRVGII